MEAPDRVFNLCLHDNNYRLAISSKNNCQDLQLIDEDTQHQWKNKFSAQYIEDITKKLENHKKFAIFVKMLISGIEGESKSVMVDILSEKEIALLKTKRKTNTSTSSLEQSMRSEDARKKNPGKRYIIVTYIVEFDKVHYPLPLFFEEKQDVEFQVKTITELRSELDMYKKNSVVNTSHMTGDISSMRKTNGSNFKCSSDGVFMTGTGHNTDVNILQSIPFQPQVTQSQDQTDYKQVLEDNKKLKASCTTLESNLQKYKSFLNLGAVEQEMILKSSEVFELNKQRMIEDQKKELQCFTSKMSDLNKSMIEKDKEIEEWKKIADQNIVNTGNSSMRDLKLKSKEVETLKRQVETLKTSELNLKKKQKELEKDVDGYKKQNKLPNNTFSYGTNRESNSRGKNTSGQGLAYNNSSGSARRNIADRNRSNSQQSYKSGANNRSNSPGVGLNKVRSDSNNNRFRNNYTSPGGANPRRDLKPGQKMGYNVNDMKLFGKSNSRDKKTNSTGLISGTNYLQRNKQALKNSAKPSPRNSNVDRYGSITSKNSRNSNVSNNSRGNSFDKKIPVRTRDRSPGNNLGTRDRSPANVQTNDRYNYLGRRSSRSNSRNNDRSLNRSVNKSVNDSIEERRNRVLGGNKRVENNFIQQSNIDTRPKRDFVAENKAKLDARKKALLPKNTDNILAGLNSRNNTEKKTKPTGLYNKSNKQSVNTTNLNIIDETKIESKEMKGIDDRLTQLQDMLKQAKKDCSN